MTPEQEFDINNALLTLMYEWKLGVMDQPQALKEFKQCLKYYSRMEDVMVFQEDKLIDELVVKHYGVEKTIERAKEEMAEMIAKRAIASNCVSFEEVEQWHPDPVPHRHFRMKMEAIIQTKHQPTTEK